MNFDEYDKLIARVYDAGSGHKSLATMLNDIGAALGATASAISIYDEARRTITHTFIASNGAMSLQTKRQIKALYREGVARLVDERRASPARRFTDIVPEPHLRATRWFRLQSELGNAGHAILADTDIEKIQVRLAVARSTAQPNFDSAQVEILDRLVRHFGRAFQSSIRIFSPYVSHRGLQCLIHDEGLLADVFVREEQIDTRFASRFSLTPAETRVLTVMLKGMTRQAASAELRVGIDCIGSHMRQIYAKTGTHRLPELMALMKG